MAIINHFVTILVERTTSSPGTRPDPDQLLAQIRGEEQRARRGKLRIYFGASAGVGKTYAMLSAAQRECMEGRELLVGVVETHGRSETAELLAGLEQLPLREVPYRGRTLMACGLWFFALLGFFGLNSWIAVLLKDHGYSIVKSVGFELKMCM